MCPIRPNVLWAMDFQFDTLANGRTIKMLNVIDEFTRECLAIDVDHSIDADDVVATLDRHDTRRGVAPVYVRFDNGPEFVAHAIADWCRFAGTSSMFIDPGSPWQNAWIESFNGKFRDEFLNGWQFDSLREARVLIEDWRIDYNWKRPHTAHGDLTRALTLCERRTRLLLSAHTASSPPSGPPPTHPKPHSTWTIYRVPLSLSDAVQTEVIAASRICQMVRPRSELNQPLPHDAVPPGPVLFSQSQMLRGMNYSPWGSARPRLDRRGQSA